MLELCIQRLVCESMESSYVKNPPTQTLSFLLFCCQILINVLIGILGLRMGEAFPSVFPFISVNFGFPSPVFSMPTVLGGFARSLSLIWICSIFLGFELPLFSFIGTHPFHSTVLVFCRGRFKWGFAHQFSW
ncbi:hypothetical protein RchiOBHm_Chr4g0431681 [Rosa chinensis]|uniref:Uncharacterized protein n=1 Tax=Rosa chinensis TaxID=74649 RepID=A0A2P6R0R7_ROSCH|nr:hypothetical protein RchiOBHm_Chr4g0431681 [Rosa chinensis]